MNWQRNFCKFVSVKPRGHEQAPLEDTAMIFFLQNFVHFCLDAIAPSSQVGTSKKRRAERLAKHIRYNEVSLHRSYISYILLLFGIGTK